MNVVFLTLAYPENEEDSNIYTDLMSEFIKNGHSVKVLCQQERRQKKLTRWTEHRGIPVLRIRTGNITKTNIVEKAFSTLQIERLFIKAIQKYLNKETIDLIIYSTPPITFASVVKMVKLQYGAKSYLLLKDIFPQNAIDLGLIKSHGLINMYFKRKEKKLYNLSDTIGCMSQGNIEFILTHNAYITSQKVELNPNSIIPSDNELAFNKEKLRQKLGIPEDAVIFIYGGNLGKPQGVDFLIETLQVFRDNPDLYLLIVGNGTEYTKIVNHLKLFRYQNVILESYLPKKEYDELVEMSDIGMIYLDERFTIPNIPSRLLSYMDKSKAVFAITDSNTDLKKIIYDANCGYYSLAGDLEEFKNVIQQIQNCKDDLLVKGINGRKYLEDNFHVKNSYNIIMKHFKGCKQR